MNIEHTLTLFRNNVPLYERFTDKLSKLIHELLELNGVQFSTERRVKSETSFREKITNPDKHYKYPLLEITDICGARIILRNLSDIDTTLNIIREEFQVDETNSVDKSTELNIDQFGYNSIHIVVSTKAPRSNTTEWPQYAGMKAEVQIRTNLQHAWSLISHKFDYKNRADIPAHIRRRLFRLNALFELADEELNEVIKDIQKTQDEYTQQIRTGDTPTDLNIDSLRIYNEFSHEVTDWQEFITKELGINVASWGDLSRDIKIALHCGIENINQINQILVDARPWGKIFFSKYFHEHCKRNNCKPSDITLVLNGVVTILMIASRHEEFTTEILEKEFGWFYGDYLLNIAKQTRTK